MPKESFLLKSFEGGLNTHADARDIENTSVSFSDGLSFSHSGKIKLLGDGFEDTLNSIFSGGLFTNNLLTFKYDYDLGMISADGQSEFDTYGSGTGYIGKPKFRADGVTYYVVTTGLDNNELTIVAQYEEDETQVFTTVPSDSVSINSSIRTDSFAYPPDGNPLYQDFQYQRQTLHVGPDSDADITGYFVNGGFRYCDANFQNKNNNIVGYFGHINQSFLSELRDVKVYGDGDEIVEGDLNTDMSFTRNHWHADTYEHYQRRAEGDTEYGIDWSFLNNKTKGFKSCLDSVVGVTSDGRTAWNDTDIGSSFHNYKFFIWMAPNADRYDEDTGESDYSTHQGAGDSIEHFRYKETMEDGHELKRRWYIGVSTCYDGDPQGICQETGITVATSYTSSGVTQIRKPWVYDFKTKETGAGVTDATAAWTSILACDEDTGTGTNGNAGDSEFSPADAFKWGDLDAFPKLYFSWTFLPWWSDHELICPGASNNHLKKNRPLYDARTTGFRVYMQEVDDPEQKWCNVATIDALRGVVTYEGCNVEQHPWIPRGILSNPLYDDDDILSGTSAGYEPHRLEPDGDEAQQQTVACWSNTTTGRTQLRAKDGSGTSWINHSGLTFVTPTGSGNAGLVGVAIDPYLNSRCNDSVNIESIPDVTYELLNGYKERYSPTATHFFWESFWSGTMIQYGSNPDSEEDDTPYNTKALQKSFGDVYRFKTATILNDKVYIGNILSVNTGKHHPDRILKSETGQHDIFADDGFHHIDLATGDGDSIVYIENYFGKLFVWKHHALYVIKITDEGDEMIEATHHHYGIDNRHSVVLTKHGPVWFNDGGVYLHDMEGKIHNLITERINRGKYIKDYSSIKDELLIGWGKNLGIVVGDERNETQFEVVNDFFAMNYIELLGLHQIETFRSNIGGLLTYIADYTIDILDWDKMLYNSTDVTFNDIYINQIQFGWKGFVGSDGNGNKPTPRIGYVAVDDKVIIVKNATDGGMSECSGDAYIFDFYTKNWSYGRKLFPYGNGAFKSNFVNDAKGNLVYFYSIDNQMDNNDEVIQSISKWSDKPSSKESIQLITKDIDFESPGVRKTIHKIYITVAGNVQPNVSVLYAINGSKKFNPLNTFDGVQNYNKDSGFVPAELEIETEDMVNNWYTAILKPNSDGESVKNVYSIQLMFVGNNQLTKDPSSHGFVHKDFQINDITIIYRSKNAN